MNATRRSELEKINEKLCDLRTQLEDLLEDEQEYFEAMPENLQGSERGQESEDAISNIECAISDLFNAEEYLCDTAGYGQRR